MEMATYGAATTLKVLKDEREKVEEQISRIIRNFPDLRALAVTSVLPATSKPTPKRKPSPSKPRKRRLTVAARKAISVRMKKLWAQRRKAKAKK